MKRKKIRASAGRKLLHKEVEELIKTKQLERKETTSDDEFFYLLGYESGLEHGANTTHKNAIQLLINTKKEISELSDDVELFKYEIEFHHGYCYGIEKVLDLNRGYFAQEIPVVIIIYVPNNVLLTKYDMAFKLSDYVPYYSKSQAHKRFFISEDINAVKSLLLEVAQEQIECSLLVIYEDRDMIPHQNLDILSDICKIDIFLLSDINDINVKSIINKIESYCYL